MAVTKEEVVQFIESMTVLELSQLVKELETMQSADIESRLIPLNAA